MTSSGVTPAEVRRVVLASIIGATIEWYDFFLYGAVAGIVFNRLFFPTNDPLISTLLAYTTFAIGFVARPVGGFIFGHFGDKIGRKSMLVLTLMIMGVATVLIGLLPTYGQIGVAAPILLLVLRVLQGVGLGGEWGGAVLMTYEYAPPGKRGLYASLPQIGLAVGLCLSSAVFALMSNYLTEEQFLNWGWRAAFIASFVLVVVGLYIRLRILETPDFQRIKEEGRAVAVPFAEMLRKYPGSVMLGMGARYIDGVFFNVFAVFSIAYLVKTVHVPQSTALWSVAIAAFAMIFTIPFFGAVSDRFGRATTFAVGALLLAIVTYPALMALSTGNTQVVFATMLVAFGILYAICYGPEAGMFADLFDPSVRYTGISFVYQFSGIFSSGITPIVAAWLIAKNGGQPWYLAAYVVFASLVSMVCAMAIASRGKRAAAELKIA